VNSPVTKAMVHLCTRWFRSMGIINEYPVVLGYRRTPTLKLDDAVDEVMSRYVVWPSRESVGGQHANLRQAYVAFTRFVRTTANKALLRKQYVEHIRAHIQSIGYTLALGGDFSTQAEKSAYLNLCDPFSATGESKYLPQPAGNYLKPVKATVLGETAQTVAFRELLEVVQQGPIFRFGKLMSNA